MIGRILLCDNCHQPDGALPSLTGGDSRLATRRGGIRRVVIGSLDHVYASRPQPLTVVRLDLCSSCRRPFMLEGIQQTYAERHAFYGTFAPS